MNQHHLDSHLFEVFYSKRGEIFQPVFSTGKPGDIAVVQAQRPHNVPLECGCSRFGNCFALKNLKQPLCKQNKMNCFTIKYLWGLLWTFLPFALSLMMISPDACGFSFSSSSSSGNCGGFPYSSISLFSLSAQAWFTQWRYQKKIIVNAFQLCKSKYF